MKTSGGKGAGWIWGGSALASGLAASLCCVGPLVFAGLGLGSFGLAAFFDRARPFLAAAMVIFGFMGLRWAHRSHEVECEDGSCKMESPSRAVKVVLWTMVLSGFAFYFLPHFL